MPEVRGDTFTCLQTPVRAFPGNKPGLNLFAWRATKNVQLCYNEAKWSILRTWDKALFRFEK